ncbi:hypothetical protein Gotri_027310, partial [Gossypium trilobum]|nr:hypothetical protein [Gossypium trilobum]
TSSNEGGLDKTKLFYSKELEIATDQYNGNRILGCGGQGMVYKGMLSDGRIVAVKKSKTVNEGYLEQFINEIFILFGQDGQKDEIVAVAQLAKRCLNLDGRYRPTMKEVAMELERLRTRQGDCINTHQLKQAEVIVRKSIESWDFTSFSIEHYP